MATLALPLNDAGRMKRRVTALAENRPAVYRMMDESGRIIYVGKARRLRARLLSYFRARYPTEKAARILAAAADIAWDYKPSEFAALLHELRAIHRHRPPFNTHMNRRRHAVFIKVFPGPAPKIAVGRPARADVRYYGPFLGAGRLADGVRALNDVLGLRDCALSMPMAYQEQRDLFADGRRAGCLRHALGTCTGPCAGFVSEEAYAARVRTALAFLEGRAIAPVDTVVDEMMRASKDRDYERAASWRNRFDRLTWLLGAAMKAHSAVEALSFVYHVPGAFGDDRSYVLRRARVCAEAPTPHTPIEREAFRALVREHGGGSADPGPLPIDAIDEALLLLRWFRSHPGALRRTVPLEEGSAEAAGR